MLGAYDPVEALFYALVRWLVLLLVKDTRLAHDNRRQLHRCLHVVDTRKPGTTEPAVVVSFLTSGELYKEFTELLLSHAWSDREDASVSSVFETVIDVLLRVGQLSAREIETEGIDSAKLMSTRPFYVNTHIAIMASLVRSMDERELAISSRVVRAVRQFAPYSAATESPRDPEDAIRLWMDKVADCVSSVLTHSGESIRSLGSSSPDFYVALGDGTVLASIIAYYRPDLLDMSQLQLDGGPASADIATSAHNLRVTLNAASRASVPCPLKVDDIIGQSPLLRFIALSWTGQLFRKFEELPLSSRLPHKKGVSSAFKQDFDSCQSSKPQTPQTGGRPAAHRTIRSGGQTHALYSAQTAAMAHTTHTPHQTVKSAARPVNERQESRSTLPKTSGSDHVSRPNTATIARRSSTLQSSQTINLSDTARAEHEDLEWQDQEQDYAAISEVLSLQEELPGKPASIKSQSIPSVSVRYVERIETDETAMSESSLDMNGPLTGEKSNSEEQQVETESITIEQTALVDESSAVHVKVTREVKSIENVECSNSDTMCNVEDDLTNTSTDLPRSSKPRSPKSRPLRKPPALAVQSFPYPPNDTTDNESTADDTVYRHSTPVSPMPSRKLLQTSPSRLRKSNPKSPQNHKKTHRSPRQSRRKKEIRPESTQVNPQDIAVKDVIEDVVIHGSDAESTDVSNVKQSTFFLTNVADSVAISVQAEPSAETLRLSQQLSSKLIDQLHSLPIQTSGSVAVDKSRPSSANFVTKAKALSKLSKGSRPPSTAESRPSSAASSRATPPNENQVNPNEHVSKDDVDGLAKAKTEKKRPPPVSSQDLSTYAPQVREAFLSTDDEVMARLRQTAEVVKDNTEESWVSKDIDVGGSYTIKRHHSSEQLEGLPPVNVEIENDQVYLDDSDSAVDVQKSAVKLFHTRPKSRRQHRGEGNLDFEQNQSMSQEDSQIKFQDDNVQSTTNNNNQIHTTNDEDLCSGESELISQPKSDCVDSNLNLESATLFDPHVDEKWELLRSILGSKQKEIQSIQHSKKLRWNQGVLSLTQAALAQLNSERHPIPKHEKVGTDFEEPIVASTIEYSIDGRAPTKVPKIVEVNNKYVSAPRPNILNENASIANDAIPTPNSVQKQSAMRFDIPLNTNPEPSNDVKPNVDELFARKQRQLELRQKKRAENRKATKLESPEINNVHMIEHRESEPLKEATANTTFYSRRTPNSRSPAKSTDKNKVAHPKNTEDGKRSNRKLITNAIKYTCLAGPVNEDNKNIVLKELSACLATHYLILLHDPNDVKYRALYSYNFDASEARKLCGRGPSKIKSSSIIRTFRYDSGSRRFSANRTNTITNLIDAICIATRPKKAPPSVI